MSDMNESELDEVRISKDAHYEDEEVAEVKINDMEGTDDDPNDFGNADKQTEKKNFNPLPSAPANVTEILETIARKLNELEQAQHDLIAAANNMNGAFNREEKNFATYSARMDELFELIEMKLADKIDLAVEEYINSFRKVTDIGNQNIKGFFKAVQNYQQKLGKPITAQAKTIYYLSIINAILLVGLIALRFVRL